MAADSTLDVVVVGAGPNGLAAAIALARSGRSVRVLERSDTAGGGARTADLTLPGFHHDVCSAVHPLAAASPFFRSVPMAEHGLDLVQPPIPVAHPLDGGRAAILQRDLEATAIGLGADAGAWRRLFGPLLRDWDLILPEILGPVRPPRAPVAMARFGLRAFLPAATLARARFKTDAARALLSGLAAHSMLPLTAPLSAAFALVLGTSAHAVGWPSPRHGSQSITDAMVAILREHGGEVETGRQVDSMSDLPAARVAMFDVTPRQLLTIAGDALPPGYRRSLGRYRYGPGVFKLDLALSGPIPWSNQDCRRAGTVHVGGAFEDVVASEATVHAGRHSERPFVLLAQPSLFDDSRAPAGAHVAWAYCHVPAGSTRDMADAIEAQVERFAPGFRRLILGRHRMTAAEVEAYNPNYVGGDINGGIQDWRQILARPLARWDPYSTPNPGIYICSSSTPPGGGVHGMCGLNAALSLIRRDRDVN